MKENTELVKPFLVWKIIWDLNAIDQIWILIMIFCQFAETGLNGDADLSLVYAQDSAVPCDPLLFGLNLAVIFYL